MVNGSGEAREDQFLGALLGMAIGDALGRPVAGLAASRIRERYGSVTHYLPVEFDERETAIGEVTAVTEVVLCMVESMTTNGGAIDPENINARMTFLANGPSSRWMSSAVVDGIEVASDHDGLVPEDHAPDPELGVALRGMPIGLLHAVGGYDAGILRTDAELAAALTHRGVAQSDLVESIATLMVAAARRREIPELEIPRETTGPMRDIATVADLVRYAPSFESAVTEAVALGGPANELGALAGALAGARQGASGIPQPLIDDLDARIYLSLAAPWFYRAANRRAGIVIDLRVVP